MTHGGRAARQLLVSIVVVVLLPFSALGDELVFEDHTWTKYSSAFTPIRQTTPTAVYSFDTTACGERYVGSAEITVPPSVSGTVTGTTFTADAPFTMSATYRVTYTAPPKTPPTNDPVAGYRFTIGTRESLAGTQKCQRRGEFVSVQAGTHTLTFTADCAVTTAELFAGAHLRTEFDFTTSNSVGICGHTIYSETTLKHVPASGNFLTGIVRRTYGGKTYWIPDAPIELLDAANTVVAKTYLRTDPANTARSWYRMSLPAGFDFTKQYRLKVVLQSDPDPGLAKLKVYASTTAAKPLEILTPPFTIAAEPATATKNISIDRTSTDIETTTPVVTEAAVEVYWNMWREMYVLRPVVDDRPLTFNLPLEVYLNAPSTFYCAGVAPPTCPTASAIVLQPRDSLPGGDPSVLWHEFGHYMFSEIHGGPLALGNYRTEDTIRQHGYHNGFANSYTTLSLDDGFATFWSWISSDILEFDHSPQLYYNQESADNTRAVRGDGYYSEQNFKLWEVRRGTNPLTNLPRGEEFGIAGLLWDLFDKNEDAEDVTESRWTFGGSQRIATDSISIGAAEILTIFRNRKPRNLFELYNGLKADLPAGLTSLSGNPRNSGLSQLDELFVMQGAFTDANGNWAYDYGETIGKAANQAVWNGALANGDPIDVPARPWRESVPPLANSFIQFTVPGTSPADITISYNFGPGLEKLNRTRQYSVTSGPFYIEPPPSHYPMELIISRVGSPPVRIDNQAYWNTPRIDPTLGSHVFTETSSSAPAITTLGASSALTGASVTINGSNFSSDRWNNIVRFGGTLGFVTEATPTRLVAVTPPIAAGSAPITVEVNGRVSSPAPFSITDTSSCRYYVDAAGTAFTAHGGLSRLFLYAKPSCAWTISSQSSWIKIDRGGNQTGNLAVQLMVDGNPTMQSRTGTLLINGTQLSVFQDASTGPKRRGAKH